jgi:Concanavalin A-like lectin/glucanases superfamily
MMSGSSREVDVVKSGEKSIIRVKLRNKNSAIAATTIIDWSGPTDDLAWKDQYWWRYKPAFFSFRPGLEIESARLTMVSGDAKPYRNPPRIAPPPTRRQYALSFDGKDDYVDISSLQIDARKVFTIEAWVNPIIVSPKHIPVAILGPRGGGYLMNMSGEHWAVFYYGGVWSDRNGGLSGTGPKGLAHIALVSTPEGLKLFINGQQTSAPARINFRSFDRVTGIGLSSRHNTRC